MDTGASQRNIQRKRPAEEVSSITIPPNLRGCTRPRAQIQSNLEDDNDYIESEKEEEESTEVIESEREEEVSTDDDSDYILEQDYDDDSDYIPEQDYDDDSKKSASDHEVIISGRCC